MNKKEKDTPTTPASSTELITNIDKALGLDKDDKKKTNTPVMTREAKEIFDRILIKMFSWEEVTKSAYSKRETEPTYQMGIRELGEVVKFDLTQLQGIDPNAPVTAQCAVCGQEIPANTYRLLLRKDSQGSLTAAKDRNGDIETGFFVAKRQANGQWAIEGTCRQHRDIVSLDGKLSLRSYRQAAAYVAQKNAEKKAEEEMVKRYKETHRSTIGDRVGNQPQRPPRRY